MKRLHYLDNIRILLTFLVIIHHTAIGYGAMGGWFYVSPEKVGDSAKLVLSAMLAVNQAFFMSLFFFISAYFVPASYDKKGASKYFTGRLMRLGIPLLVYIFILHPVINYGIQVYSKVYTGSFSDFFVAVVTKHLSPAHMWFVLSLLIFEGVYLIYRKISAVRFSGFFTEKFPSTLKIIYFTIACAFLAFVFRLFYSIGENVFGLQLGYFALYMAFYVMGMVASRKNWHEKLSYRNGMVWFGVSMFLVIFIFGALIYLSKHPDTMPLFIGGWHLQSLMLTVWEAFTCVGISYFLLVFFKRHFNFSNNLNRNLAANSYAVYFIHPPIVVVFTMLLEHINLLPEFKFLLATILSFAGCILLANLMRLIPGMKRIL